MGIDANYIKFNIDVIAPELLTAYNAIMETGIIPQSWKTSFITPIPKRGAFNNIENYRGISMQSVMPKIFDSFTATSSVPQGSHCRPLLYLFMCRDIGGCVNGPGAKLLLYADDTKFCK